MLKLTLIRTLRASFATALCIGATHGFAQAAAGAGPGAAASAVARPASRAPERTRKRADRRLARQVSAALGRTRGLDATRLLIRAREGEVTLSGSVPDAGQIPLAVDAAQRVDGVKSVRNLIRVVDQTL